MRDSIINAHQFLAGLNVGDPVLMHRDGKDLAVTVQRPLRRADEPFGSTEGSRVTVGYGPGRWNTEVTVEALASDPTILRRPGNDGHADYPHWPGRLPDCPACQARCHCTTEVLEGSESPCVYDGVHSVKGITFFDDDGGVQPEPSNDKQVLDLIAWQIQAEPECGSDFIGFVCNLVAGTGRSITDPEDEVDNECIEDGCDRPVLAFGRCSKHYAMRGTRA